MTIPAVAPEMIEVPPGRAGASPEASAASEEEGFAAFLARAAGHAGEGQAAQQDLAEEAAEETIEDLLALLVAEDAALAATEEPALEDPSIALAAPVAPMPAGNVTTEDLAAAAVPAPESGDPALQTLRSALSEAEEAGSSPTPAERPIGTVERAGPAQATDPSQAIDPSRSTDPAESARLASTLETARATPDRVTAESALSARPVEQAPVQPEATPAARAVSNPVEAAAVAEVAGADPRTRDDADARRESGTGGGLPAATVAQTAERGATSNAFELPANLAYTPPTRTEAPTETAQTLIPPPVAAPVTTTAVPTEPAPIPSSGAPAEALPVHVEWLTARGGGSARLQLHPANLGEVEVNVNVRGNAVDVVIRALEPAAQAAVAQTRDLLADGLAAQELRMEQFEVRGTDDRAENRSQDQRREDFETAAGFGDSRDAEERSQGTPTAQPTGHGEDTPLAAQPSPTQQGASGVDLHI